MMKDRRHGRSEGNRGGGRKQRSKEEEQGRSVGGTEMGREGNGKGGTLRRTLASTGIQYTAHKTTHNATLAIATLVLQLHNCKWV